MEKHNLDDGSSHFNHKQDDPDEVTKRQREQCIQNLVHACQCRAANCRLESCPKMKRILQHVRDCKQTTSGGCYICIQLIALCCYHGKDCNNTVCPVPYCLQFQQKFKQQHQESQKNAHLLKRHIEIKHRQSSIASGAAAAPVSGPGLVSPGGLVIRASGAFTPKASPVSPVMTGPPCAQYCQVVFGLQQNHPGPGLKPASQTPSANAVKVVKQDAKKFIFQLCAKFLVHACQCRDDNCQSKTCKKMKRIVRHFKVCKGRANGSCPTCKKLIALCYYHSNNCNVRRCRIPFCFKHKFMQQQLKQALEQVDSLIRHIESLHFHPRVGSLQK